jgi:hypothetical protein
MVIVPESHATSSPVRIPHLGHHRWTTVVAPARHSRIPLNVQVVRPEPAGRPAADGPRRLVAATAGPSAVTQGNEWGPVAADCPAQHSGRGNEWATRGNEWGSHDIRCSAPGNEWAARGCGWAVRGNEWAVRGNEWTPLVGGPTSRCNEWIAGGTERAHQPGNEWAHHAGNEWAIHGNEWAAGGNARTAA